MVILKEWLRDVYIFEHSGAEPGDDVFEKFEQASSTAIEGLFSLFCDRDECQSHEAIQKFLSGARSQDDVGMLSRLQGWMDELLNDLGSSPGKVSLSDTSPEMIQHHIARYLQHEETYDSSGRLTPSPWPMVKLVKYGLQPATHLFPIPDANAYVSIIGRISIRQSCPKISSWLTFQGRLT